MAVLQKSWASSSDCWSYWLVLSGAILGFGITPPSADAQGQVKPANPKQDRNAAAKQLRRIEGWGEVVDPDGDCKIERHNGGVLISVPGTVHDLYPPTKVNAPRVQQDVEGDFSARVKVSGDFYPGKEPARGFNRAYHGAGLLVWQDENNYVRLERMEVIWKKGKWKLSGRHWYYTPLLQQRLGGDYEEFVAKGPSGTAFNQTAISLRLDRNGDMMSAYFSTDGQEWKLVKTFKSLTSKKVSIAVSALNGSNHEFNVSFDDFAITHKEANK